MIFKVEGEVEFTDKNTKWSKYSVLSKTALISDSGASKNKFLTISTCHKSM